MFNVCSIFLGCFIRLHGQLFSPRYTVVGHLVISVFICRAMKIQDSAHHCWLKALGTLHPEITIQTKTASMYLHYSLYFYNRFYMLLILFCCCINMYILFLLKLSVLIHADLKLKSTKWRADVDEKERFLKNGFIHKFSMSGAFDSACQCFSPLRGKWLEPSFWVNFRLPSLVLAGWFWPIFQSAAKTRKWSFI